MESYLMMLYVTLEQESALKSFFVGQGWAFCKPDLSVVTDRLGPITSRLSTAREEIDVTDVPVIEEQQVPKLKNNIPATRAVKEKHIPKQSGKRKTKTQTQPSKAPKQAKIMPSTSVTESDEIVEVQKTQTIDSEVEDTGTTYRPVTIEMGNGQEIQIKIESESQDTCEGELVGEMIGDVEEENDNVEAEEDEDDVDAVEATDIDYEGENAGVVIVKTEDVSVEDSSISQIDLPEVGVEPKMCSSIIPLEPLFQEGEGAEICPQLYGTSDEQAVKRPSVRWTNTELGYACERCSFLTRSRQSISKHYSVLHSKKQTPNMDKGKMFKCHQCSQTYTTQRDFTLHVEAEHEGKCSYICKVCNDSFSCKQEYQEHANKHITGIRLRCQLCSKSFSGTFSLKRHMENKCNLNAKTYSCEICGYAFLYKQSLVDHVKGVHNTGIRYSCLCGKKFKWRSSLGHHRRSCQIKPNDV